MQFKKRLKKELLLEFIPYIIGIISISTLYLDNILLTLVLFAAYFLGLFIWHKKHDLIFFVIGAIIGPIGEIICIHYGVWHYSNPSFLGIPFWLPLAWGLAVMLIKRVSETFVKIELL